MPYFNYSFDTAESSWDRFLFVRRWWQMYAGDRSWTPPDYPTLRWALNPARNPHLARQQPLFLTIEARHRPPTRIPHGGQAMPAAPITERPMATVLILQDNRSGGRTGYLALPHLVNDEETVDRLEGWLMETLPRAGIRRLIGPTGLAPHLEGGLLEDYWHLPAPAHTPYNPPYVQELLTRMMRPMAETRHLYHLPVPAEPVSVPGGPAQLRPLEPARLAGDLLPLLIAASGARPAFPAPDRIEAQFLLRWLGSAPLLGWLAELNGRPVGFILLQADQGARRRRANGGRNLLLRAWLALARRWPVTQGRLLFGAVLPEWRGQGIGRQLRQQALQTAAGQGWRTLITNPLSPDQAALLTEAGARARQTIRTYEWTVDSG